VQAAHLVAPLMEKPAKEIQDEFIFPEARDSQFTRLIKNIKTVHQLVNQYPRKRLAK